MERARSPFGAPPRLPRSFRPRLGFGRASWNHRMQTGGPSPAPVQRAPRGPTRAGRDDASAARKRSVSLRPREPPPLRLKEYPRDKASFVERDGGYVTVRGTRVKANVALFETRGDYTELDIGSKSPLWGKGLFRLFRRDRSLRSGDNKKAPVWGAGARPLPQPILHSCVPRPRARQIRKWLDCRATKRRSHVPW
jgi:hypothetical protein